MRTRSYDVRRRLSFFITLALLVSLGVQMTAASAENLAPACPIVCCQCVAQNIGTAADARGLNARSPNLFPSCKPMARMRERGTIWS